jgi:PAS domain S-box-containing protein
MSKRPSRKLHSRLEGLFTAVPEPDPSTGTNGGARQVQFASGVPGGWLWEADLEGRYTWCSPEVERFLGWRAADLLGKHVASIGWSDESAAMVRPMINSGRAVDGVRLEARGGDGSEIQLLFSAQLRPGPNGKPAGYRGAVQVLSITPAAMPMGHVEVVEPMVRAPSPAPVEVEPAVPAPVTPSVPRPEEVEPIAWPSMDLEAPAPEAPEMEAAFEAPPSEVAPEAPAVLPEPEVVPQEKRRVLDRPTRPVARPQTGALRRGTGTLRGQTGPLASQLAVAAAVAADEVRPIDSPPLIPAWGPTTAYLDTSAGIQPISAESGRMVMEPRIEGSRLLVPIKLKDEVLGVLASTRTRPAAPGRTMTSPWPWASANNWPWRCRTRARSSSPNRPWWRCAKPTG